VVRRRYSKICRSRSSSRIAKTQHATDRKAAKLFWWHRLRRSSSGAPPDETSWPLTIFSSGRTFGELQTDAAQWLHWRPVPVSNFGTFTTVTNFARQRALPSAPLPGPAHC